MPRSTFSVNVSSNSSNGKRRKMPPSAKRLVANRRNALKSTGPRTVAGTSRSRMNALKHGLCAEKLFPQTPVSMVSHPVLPGECEATYHTVREELCKEFQPRTPSENWMIDHIATQLWRLMRAHAIERQLVEQEAIRIASERMEEARHGLKTRATQEAYDANGEDTTTIEPLTPAMVVASLFQGDDSSPMMRLIRYQRQAHNLVLRMFVRLAALRKRSNDELYSREDLDAFKYKGHSEYFRKTGWPDMSDRSATVASPTVPGTVGQAERGTAKHEVELVPDAPASGTDKDVYLTKPAANSVGQTFVSVPHESDPQDSDVAAATCETDKHGVCGGTLTLTLSRRERG